MKQVRCSPKSAILPSDFNPLPIGSSEYHFVFLLGMAVVRLKKKTTTTKTTGYVHKRSSPGVTVFESGNSSKKKLVVFCFC